MKPFFKTYKSDLHGRSIKIGFYRSIDPPRLYTVGRNRNTVSLQLDTVVYIWRWKKMEGRQGRLTVFREGDKILLKTDE